MVHVRNSHNTGMSALPELYMHIMPEGGQHPRASMYTSDKAQVPVL